jgi:geranylgeranyl diphosphate synthase type 3
MLKLPIILYCRFDDMQGSSILHGDIPVAHSIYGVPRTMSAGHYAVSIVMQKVANLDQPEALTVLQEQMLEWCRGRGTEIYWRENYTCPSVEEYQEMVKRSKNEVRVSSRF